MNSKSVYFKIIVQLWHSGLKIQCCGCCVGPAVAQIRSLAWELHMPGEEKKILRLVNRVLLEHSLFICKGNKTWIRPQLTVGFIVRMGCVTDMVMAWCPGVFLGSAKKSFPTGLTWPHFPLFWNKSSPITASIEWSIWANLTISRAKRKEPSVFDSSPNFEVQVIKYPMIKRFSIG